jgi:hypothetical protein
MTRTNVPLVIFNDSLYSNERRPFAHRFITSDPILELALQACVDITSDSQLEYTFTNSVECMMSNLHNQWYE